MRALMWFRADLRVADNAALHAACLDADEVVAVFTICPEQWHAHDWAPVKVDFLLRNLHALKERLESLKISLRILTFSTFDGAPKALLKLAEDLKADSLYFNREYEVNEAARDDAVTRVFEKSGRKVSASHDQCLLPPGSVKTNDGGWYGVFSPFRRRLGEVIAEGELPEVLKTPRARSKMLGSSDEVPGSLDGFDGLKRPDLWPAGEDEAGKILKRFAADRIDAYADKRDLPGINGTSRVSPYLAVGVISPRQCLHAALDAGGSIEPKPKKKTGPNVWINEVVWREFYKHLTVGHPSLCKHKPFKPETDRLRWNDDEDAFAAWCAGRTGYPIVDAAMRQLNQTGWMHNRCRMIAAMFLTKDLFIDWRKGEKYFMQHLVDGDLASNNGGWQWSASTGTDAAPYFRIFNPVSQSKNCDPDGKYIRTFVPELADVKGDAVHEPWTLPGLLRSQLDYPERIVDHAEARERVLKAFKAL